MRRSDFIEKLVFSIELHSDNDPSWLEHPEAKKAKVRAYEFADKILTDLEDEGMLPPPKNIDIINDRLFYAYYPEGSISEKSENTNKLNIKELWDKE